MTTRPPGTPTVDLTDSGDAGSINNAIFATGPVQPAGSGAFNSFVQIQHKGTEQGYNTDASAQFDEKNSAPHNHSILLADVPIVVGDGSNGTIEGLTYREFLLDLNEPNGGSKPYISLDALQIWQEESGSLTGFTSGAGFSGAHTNYLAYNMDAGGDHWVALNDGLSHGSGQSDVRILIPDSDFINDTAHRYVTVYSALGQQDGWDSDGGFEEWGLHGTSGGPRSALSIDKQATVPGGTADHAGEVISYSITLSNTGNVSLTGITVSDPSVSDLTRGLDAVGNNDNVLNAGEVWSYSAHHTVTQAEIDAAANGGTDATITNTVSAGSDQTGHDLAHLVTDTTSVPVESRPDVTLTKMGSVADGTADHAGDVINYTISVAAGPSGNTTLTNPIVTDPSIVGDPIVDPNAPILNHNAQKFVPLLDGDNNLGDNNNNGVVDPTDQNNARDPGETWQYVYLGDTTQDGFHDPGETWTAFNLGDTNNDGIHQVGETWVGDTNQNGIQEAGERWQFKNVWDTNHNGLQDGGEVWHYQNFGDDNQNGVQDSGETFQYYNIGDTNQNGFEDPGETFQSYNVGDTNQNGVQDPGETFQFSHVVPGVDANNDGFNDGDTNQDGKINAGETWQFAVGYTVTQADIDNRHGGVPTVDPALTHDNTATVETNEGATASGSTSIAIVQHPHLSVTKIASIPDGDHDGKIDSPADDITYTITVVNDGNMTLTGVHVNDSVVGALSAHTETGGIPATNGDGELNVGETWTYTSVYDTQQSDIDNHGNVDGTADDNIHNTASVTTAQGAGGSASADVPIDYQPHLTVTKVASIPDSDHNGQIDSPADDITYTVTVVNDGNVTLTGVNANDSITGALTTHTDTGGTGTNGDSLLNVGETWTYTSVYDTQQSDIDNRGSVDGTMDNNIHNTASVTTNEGASGSASADVPIDYNPQMTLVKDGTWHDTGNLGSAEAGETISYTFTVTNTGNVTLHDVGVTDTDEVTVSGPVGGIPALAPGAVDDTSYSGTYTVQETDVVQGYHDNTSVAAAIETSVSSGNEHVILPTASESAMNFSIPIVIGGDPGSANGLSDYDIAPVLNGGGFNAGDANADGGLNVGEAWQYTASQSSVEVASLVAEFNPMGNAIDVSWHWL